VDRHCCEQIFVGRDRFTLTSELGTYYKVAFLQNP
jgi:hypothetical protein